MKNASQKVPIPPHVADFRTAHLQPVIDFLKAHGNEPSTGDQFHYNRDGLGVYGFAQPLDTQLLQEHFDFPLSISLSVDGLHDSRHFVRIQHTPDQSVRRFSFEQ
ncbi:hypothetical protein [Hymenobacter sp. 5414T-23]|uniref:hypothetical protein n=1 Tax=Hymenobacter sp. 5414T-23 TaxID=2932252 RepID=UPI001FD205C3|nr:hypothetical protein [Hymenobacter sp. 5414T-23]UOQ83280.1 hypothetical protein MUN83_20910 [Hymenobacter sp. 5414T-23]